MPPSRAKCKEREEEEVRTASGERSIGRVLGQEGPTGALQIVL